MSENLIFVFGSNLAGRHGKGAALEAVKKWGAIYGNGSGFQGRSYAIPTKDGRISGISLQDPRQTLPLETIKKYVEKFKEFAKASPQYTFQVTRIGCGLAGYKDFQIAPMFKGSPSNCTFDPIWEEYIYDR